MLDRKATGKTCNAILLFISDTQKTLHAEKQNLCIALTVLRRSRGLLSFPLFYVNVIPYCITYHFDRRVAAVSY